MKDIYQLQQKDMFGKIALGVGLIGLITSGAGYFIDKTQFFFSYLTAFVFWMSIALGGLFFTQVHHLVNAKWSVVLRRFFENIMTGMWILLVFFLPLLLGLHDLYHWSHTEIAMADPILSKKIGYLNINFFVIRSIVYFAIWIFLSFRLFRLSMEQDQRHTPELTSKMKVMSGIGTILFALTITYASFDWLMSLDPHWYSTIFGLYFFSGCVVGIIAFLTLIVLHLHFYGHLRQTITVEHYHDLGKLLFGFTIFWAYMAYSQYFLIWYANIPEETIWFSHRWQGSWKYISLILLFGHFVLPFLLLMPRITKRKALPLGIMSVWMLIMHWLDLYWLIMPNFHKHTAHFSWLDFTTVIGIGGIFCWYIWIKFRKHSLVPVNDPMLEASIHFHNI